MAFRIDFYNFNKKENSTKLPSGVSQSYDCIIKRGSPLFNPLIELNLGLATAPPWNYCYIPNFGRYYWVREWTFENALWTAECAVDVLATYRTEIGDEDLYALRSAYAYDGDIVDSLYPRKANHQFAHTAINMPWTSAASGCFVLGITNNEPHYGTLEYYVLDTATMKAVINYLLDDTFLESQDFDISDPLWQVQKSLVDPLQYIKSAVFLPIPYDNITGSPVSYVEIFDWGVPVPSGGRAKRVIQTVTQVSQTYNIVIPVHPMTQSRGRYVNCAQYTTYTLAFPPFGIIPIDANALVTENILYAKYSIDLPTGTGVLDISIDGLILNRIEAQIGVPIQLSQITRDYVGVALAAVDTAAGGVSAFTGDIGGGISKAAHGIADGLAAITPKQSTIGSGGSYSQLYQTAGLYADFAIPVDDDRAKNGRPLCRVIKPKDYPGYLLIQDGDVPINGTREEANQIRAYLQTGFYYE